MRAIAGTYLERIVADVHARLGDEPELHSDVELPPTRSLARSIAARRRLDALAVIAEVKRRSPSVGAIREDVDPAHQGGRYAAGGAAGISVLTERDYFGGSLDDLRAVRSAVDVPVLRKDFVVDERQLRAARAAGADAVLLIAAVLDDDARLDEFVEAAHALDLEVLLEVHDEPELERALASRADVIGINNRDLRSFAVDLGVSARLAPLAASDPRPLVSESGVRGIADASRLSGAGVDALLVGEALMRARHAGGLLRELATASGAQQ